jgi:hypothetical protein
MIEKLKTRLALLLFVLLIPLVGLAGVSDMERRARAYESPEQTQDKVPHKKTRLTYADRQAWREILKWSQECEADFGDHGADYAGLEFYKLTPGRYLVEVECEIAAYQSVKFYLLYDENVSPARSKFLTFKIYSGENERSMIQTKTDALLGVSTFNHKQKTLTIFSKLSRFGDCGSIATYSFRSGEPVLTDFRIKLNCDGSGMENPYRWKRVGPPRAKRRGR